MFQQVAASLCIALSWPGIQIVQGSQRLASLPGSTARFHLLHGPQPCQKQSSTQVRMRHRNRGTRQPKDAILVHHFAAVQQDSDAVF